MRHLILSVYPVPGQSGVWGLYQAIGATDHRISVHASRDDAIDAAARSRAAIEAHGDRADVRILP